MPYTNGMAGIYPLRPLWLGKPNRGLFSFFCTWSKGVDTLLPQADTAMFCASQDEAIGPVPWTEVVARAGHLLKDPGLYPKRYRVRDFPDAATLGDLAALSAANCRSPRWRVLDQAKDCPRGSDRPGFSATVKGIGYQSDRSFPHVSISANIF